MFGPGGVLFLLRHEMLLSWRNFRATGKGRHVRRFIFYSSVAAVLGFGGYWVARVLSSVAPEPTTLMLGATGVVFAILFTFMVSQAMMLITETMYQRGDLDLLLSSPLPPWRMLSVRMSAIAINVGLFYLVLTAAVFVWLPTFGGWAWMGFAPSLLLLTFFSTAVALAVARLMFWLIGPKNTRVVAQITASLIGAAFFLAWQIPNVTGDRENRVQFMEEAFRRVVPILGDPDSPLSLPARAAFGVGGDIWLWAAIALGAFVAAVWWYASSFAADAAAISGLGARRRRAARRARAMRGGVRGTLVRKEWRLLRRDPLLMSQILLPLLYLAPLFIIFGTRLSNEEVGRVAAAGFASAFVLLLTTFAASLAWLTVSAEDAPDLIASAPVTRDEIDLAKAIAAGAPAAALLLPLVIGAAVFVAPMAGLWLLIGGCAAILSACLIAIWRQAPGNRKEFRRRTRGDLLLNLGRSFVAFAWMGATFLAVRGWPLIALAPALVALGLLLALHESRPRQDESAL